MKKVITLFCMGFAFTAFVVACGGGGADSAATDTNAAKATKADPSTYDSARGEGRFKDVQLDEHLDPEKAARGEKVYELKCASCHKLTDEKLVGPGWAGVTTRHEPAWILNFTTNTDEMLDKDPKAQAMLEICMVRMPNQNLTDEDALSLLEFMRKNDGVK